MVHVHPEVGWCRPESLSWCCLRDLHWARLWSCPTTPQRGDQSQHRAAGGQPQGAWSRSGGGKGTSSMTKGAQDKQVSHAMPKAAVPIHPHGLWGLDSAAQGHNPVAEGALTSSYQYKQDTGDI